MLSLLYVILYYVLVTRQPLELLVACCNQCCNRKLQCRLLAADRQVRCTRGVALKRKQTVFWFIERVLRTVATLRLNTDVL